MDEWLSLLERVGWPGAGLFAVAYILHRVARWAEPKVTAVVDSHVSLVATLQQHVPEQISRMKSHSDRFDATTKTLAAHGEKLDETGALVKDIHNIVVTDDRVARVAARRSGRIDTTAEGTA